MSLRVHVCVLSLTRVGLVSMQMCVTVGLSRLVIISVAGCVVASHTVYNLYMGTKRPLVVFVSFILFTACQ